MALNTGIESLDAGAPDIKYTGKEGPQDPRMASAPGVDAELFQMYRNALQSGQLPKGTTFEMFKELLQQSRGSQQGQGVMAAAHGGRIGLKGGQLVKPGPGRPGYNGGDPIGGYGPGGSWGGGGGEGPPGGGDRQMTYTAPVIYTAPVSDYSTQDLEEQVAIDLGEPTAQFTPEERDQQGYGTPTIQDPADPEWTMAGPIYTGTEDAEEQAEKDLEWALNYGILEKDPVTGETREGPNVRNLETGEIVPKPEPTITTGGEGEGSIVTDTTSTVPITTEDTGLSEADYRALVDAYGWDKDMDVQIRERKDQENLSHLVDQRMYNPYAENIQTLTDPRKVSAQGGRAGYDRGGVAGLRQAYGLGDIVKAPFKAAKKILKSPIGKAALMYAATAGLGNVMAPGAAKWGNLKWLSPKTAFGIGKPGFGNLANIGAWFQRSPDQLSKLGIELDAPWYQKINPWKATAAITSIASVPLWARPENWDEMDQAEQEAWLKDYYQKVAAYNEGKGDIPVGLTAAADFPNPEYAAQGGRIGFWHGGYHDDDEEETLRASALASLPEYRLFSDRRRNAKGGRIGYADGTMSPALQKRMMELLMQGMSPDKIREEAEKQLRQDPYIEERMGIPGSPIIKEAAEGGRIGAQEGGLMNLGGMEKDYRQEGGFVPIGGQEKADDVPARLSKNEFVFTADAVRAAGGGDIDAGAEVMENVMENLEAGGKVSEDSQGLEGARDMFATSQQLEKRII